MPTDPEETHDLLDQAVTRWCEATSGSQMFVTGWVLSVVGIRPDNDDPEVSTYSQTRKTGMQFHAALGLHHNAIHDMHDGTREL